MSCIINYTLQGLGIVFILGIISIIIMTVYYYIKK